MTTRHSARPSANATARPTPLPPPVTIATPLMCAPCLLWGEILNSDLDFENHISIWREAAVHCRTQSGSPCGSKAPIVRLIAIDGSADSRKSHKERTHGHATS